MSVANAEATRAAGLRQLNQFLSAAGSRYAKARNFDFGPERRGNVSMLSPFIRHRLVLEEEVLDAVLSQHSLATASKFVQEVFWRTYYKGWLEHRPGVWEDYRSGVARCLQDLDSENGALDRYSEAIEGRTGIQCFDAWVSELISTGYLHNHARMWFASIWIYTLDLPWQLGADFFYRHLIDGDAASNTLSWRWVCGLHTPGKTYLARSSNIARFTDQRFNPKGQLASSAPPLSEARVFPLHSLPASQSLQPGQRFGLLITEEDGYAESLSGSEEPVAILGVVATDKRSPLEVGQPARTFARGAVSDAVARAARRLGVSGELSDADDWGTLLVEWATRHQLDSVITPYAPVGPVAESLATAGRQLERQGIPLLQLRRSYDSAAWPHARRGFFKLKNKIPAILGELDIAADRGDIDSKAG